ncbi:Catenin-beta-like protein [Kockovaella imperatae]|uniref:Catenin-beta-like protein n=1 Tax=Kockovaella imperatae TaxID=4999 RepID=A0A1Y1UBN4_9TREE|nr:Catenin-beta-like protein [Kockovaella imperatae]ORX34896.1 Catenin-beta-like protein [Kockovaella imperatae]
MDVDKLFKLPSLPASAGQKRKFTDIPSPEFLKRYKAVGEESKDESVPPTNGKGKGRAATVEDEDDDRMDYAQADSSHDDGEADEEGRFFGGGLNSEQNQILDIFDQAGDDGTETAALTLPALRRQLLRFERTVAKNAEQRGKFPDDPSKFIESESDLDSALNQFLPLTQNPPLFYPELVKQGTVALWCNLLSHENTDIAIDVVDVIRELTDEDVGAGADDLDGEEDLGESSKTSGIAEGTPMAMAEFIDELLNNSLLSLLISNLSRLNESEDADSQGVYKILSVFENLFSFMPPLAEQVVSDTDLMRWLLTRVGQKEFDSNKQYASQILAILVQTGRDGVLKLAELDGMETLLKLVSQYRKKDPSSGEEVEFMEDLFNCLCSALAEPEMKAAFLEAEGVELMVIMMKEKLLARTRAIKVLDYAMQSEDGAGNCERFVESLGLKTFFSAFMGKVGTAWSISDRHLQGDAKRKRALQAETSEFEDEEHLLGILVSLFTNLASDSAPRIRLIAKFVESGYEKVERLLEMREAAESRLRAVEADIARERTDMEGVEEVDEDTEAEWFLRKSEAGGSALGNADYVLAWVCMEDDGALRHARLMLSRKNRSFTDVISVLEDVAGNIDDTPVETENGTVDEPPLQKLAIGQLVIYLKSQL